MMRLENQKVNDLVETKVKTGLGMDKATKVEAQLYKLLLYPPGRPTTSVGFCVYSLSTASIDPVIVHWVNEYNLITNRRSL
jgi:hypothetical protein